MTQEKLTEINIEGMTYHVIERDESRALFKLSKVAVYEHQKTSNALNAYRRAIIVRYDQVKEEAYIVYSIRTRTKGDKIIEISVMPSDFGKVAWAFNDYSIAKRYYEFLKNNTADDLVKISNKNIKHLESFIKP